MQRILLILSSLLLTLSLGAATPDLRKADEAYRQKNYTEAARIYEAQLALMQQESPSETATQADCHYNLGNCYYRMKDYARAVLHYQRALRFDPGNGEAAFNLELTQTKLTDRFDRPSEMFFISWMKELVRSHSSTAWGLRGLFFLLLAFALAALYLAGRRMWLRKAGFFGCIPALFLFLCCQVFAFMQYNRFEDFRQAVVMQTADTFDTPTATAKKQQTLHAGTTLVIIDTFKDGWLQVELPDSTVTWIKESGIEKV